MTKTTKNDKFTSCDGKAPIGSAAEAARIARRLNNHKGARVTAYACRRCLKWHVGGIDSRGQLAETKAFKRKKSRLAVEEAGAA